MSKITKAAKGATCKINIFGVCNHDPATTVHCHIHKPSISGGLSLKANDALGAHGCSSCHNRVDGRDGYPPTEGELIDFYEGVLRTQAFLADKGLLWNS